jgi:hypothetical protein
VVDCYANIVLPASPVITDNCGVTLTPTGPVETGSVVCEGDYTYTWTYTDCEGNAQDYVHTVTIEYAPFRRYHRHRMWLTVMQYCITAPPVVTDNCGVTITPTGPVETGSVVCEGRLYLYLDLYRLRRNSSGLCSYSHDRVCPIPGDSFRPRM